MENNIEYGPRKEKKVQIEQIKSVQEWLPFKSILNEGILELKDSSYIKILKVFPINYNLKSEFEKQAILNSYENFFKSYSKNIQIIIQSKKQDLSNNIRNLNKCSKYEAIKEQYINYLNELNNQSKSSNKNFYLIIKATQEEKTRENKIKQLNQDYKEIKSLLSRCGNIVSQITSDKEIREILISFLNQI